MSRKEYIKDRLPYALNKIKEYGIEYYLINEDIGEIHCFNKTVDELIIYYANTGTIRNYEVKGIYELISKCLDMSVNDIIEKEFKEGKKI